MINDQLPLLLLHQFGKKEEALHVVFFLVLLHERVLWCKLVVKAQSKNKTQHNTTQQNTVQKIEKGSVPTP